MPIRFVSCLLLLLAGVAPAASQDVPDSGRPPNIVLIIGDDQAWGDFGFMGHPAIETPRLDRLAGESVVYERGYVPTSLCSPSLASIITGQYPHQHRITGNEPPRPRGVGYDDPDYRDAVREMIAQTDGCPTLPTLLANAGYRSLQTGKWWLGDFRRGGFTHGMTHGDPDRGGRHGDEGLAIGRSTMQPIADFLVECGDRPFFIWYAPFLPHSPHDPPQALLAKYAARTTSESIARYWANCERFDASCGALLDLLDEAGVAGETIVLFVIDNGWIQQEAGPRYAPRSKRSPYDGGLRTPIMIRWPGHLDPARRGVPVSSLDLAPTILTACGLSAPPAMPGIDLLDRVGVQDRPAIFGEVHLHNAIDIREPARNLTHRWCIADGWKLIVPNPANAPDDRIELFHIEVDPEELRECSSEHPDRMSSMAAMIDAWWPAVVEPHTDLPLEAAPEAIPDP